MPAASGCSKSIANASPKSKSPPTASLPMSIRASTWRVSRRKRNGNPKTPHPIRFHNATICRTMETVTMNCRPLKAPAATELELERTQRRAKQDNGRQSDQGAGNRHHENVEIALAVAHATDRKQSHHGAVVRQAVERAGA